MTKHSARLCKLDALPLCYNFCKTLRHAQGRATYPVPNCCCAENSGPADGVSVRRDRSDCPSVCGRTDGRVQACQHCQVNQTSFDFSFARHVCMMHMYGIHRDDAPSGITDGWHLSAVTRERRRGREDGGTRGTLGLRSRSSPRSLLSSPQCAAAATSAAAATAAAAAAGAALRAPCWPRLRLLLRSFRTYMSCPSFCRPGRDEPLEFVYKGLEGQPFNHGLVFGGSSSISGALCQQRSVSFVNFLSIIAVQTLESESWSFP